jgi:hypothetical protein
MPTKRFSAEQIVTLLRQIVVVLPPLLNDNLSFFQTVEDLSIE